MTKIERVKILKHRLSKMLSITIALCMVLAYSVPSMAAGTGLETGTASETQGEASASAAGTRDYNKVVIVGMDGAGAFGLQTDTPNIDRIFGQENTAITYSASSENPTISAQNWGAMLHGCAPEVHGMTNDTTSCPAGIPPSFFKLIRNQYPQASLATYAQWSTFNNLIESGTVTTNTGDCATVTANTISYLKQHRSDTEHPVVVFTHMDDADHAGHSYGYGSAQHLESLRTLDKYVGQIFDAVSTDGVVDSDTLFLLVSDHGGSGKGHGGMEPSSVNIIMAAAGHTVGDKVFIGARNRDVARIAADALGVEPADTWSASNPLRESADVVGKATFDIGQGPVSINSFISSGYNSKGELITGRYTEGYVITGTSTENTVAINGGPYDVMLQDVSINTGGSPVVLNSAEVTLTLKGNSTLTASNENQAGINVPDGSKLTINGDNTSSLNVKGTFRAASIGSTKGVKAGDITINGGRITTDSSAHRYGAGIGGGQNAGSGVITINGGYIVARGGDAYTGIVNGIAEAWGSAAGIGHGGDEIKTTDPVSLHETKIVVNGGTIVASGGVTQASTITGQSTARHGDGLGKGSDLSGSTTPSTVADIELNGGSVFTSPVAVSYQDSQRNQLYRSRIGGLDANKELSITTPTRSFKAMTNELGELCLYLPAGETSVTVGEDVFRGTVETDGSTVWSTGKLLDIGKGNIVFDSTGISGYDPSGIPIKKESTEVVLITGETSENTISVSPGAYQFVLRNAKMSTQNSPIRLAKGADVTMTLEGSSTLTASNVNQTGIDVPDGSKLTINGDNSSSLNVKGTFRAASIGSTRGVKAGEITINGGRITADSSGHRYGAGVGGGQDAGSGVITINGGYIVARGGDAFTGVVNEIFEAWGSAAGIGHGGDEIKTTDAASQHETSIVVNGGTVIATGGCTSSSSITGMPTARHGNGLGRGHDLGGVTPSTDATIAVNGGSLITSPDAISHKNSAGIELYKAQVVGLVSGKTVDVTAGGKNYQATADNDGKLCLYLPSGQNTVTVDGTQITGSVNKNGTSVLSLGGNVLSIAKGNIIFDDGTVEGYNAAGVKITDYGSGDFSITGESSANTITVNGGSHQITLWNTSIRTGNTPLSIKSGAEVKLTLKGSNTLTASNENQAGINVPDGAKLAMDGDDTSSLSVKGSYRAAGIGSTKGVKAGEITINGGRITADSSAHRYGAGVGGGQNAGGGVITVNGGYLVARGGDAFTGVVSGTFEAWGSAAGIGHGGDEIKTTDQASLHETKIVVNGGTIVAAGGVTSASAITDIPTARHGDGLGRGSDRGGSTGPSTVADIEINGGSVIQTPDKNAYVNAADLPVYKTAIHMGETSAKVSLSINGGAEWTAYTDDGGVIYTYLPVGETTVKAGEKTLTGTVEAKGDNVIRNETVSGTLAIQGTQKFGEELKADASGIVPAAAGDSMVYSWYRGDDLTASIGKGKVYKLTAADIGQVITLKAEAGGGYSGTLTAVTNAIGKAAGIPPKAPAAAENGIGTDTVTLVTEAGIQYRLGETGQWQDSGVFTGLNEGTEYKFYARTTETETRETSEAGPALTVTTQKGSYSIKLDKTGTLDLGTLTEGYEQQSGASVAVTNIGDKRITGLKAELTGAAADAFTVSTVNPSELAPKNMAIVSVAPKTGLTAGSYTATLVVTGAEGGKASLNLSVTVSKQSGVITVQDAAVSIAAPVAGIAPQDAAADSQRFRVSSTEWTKTESGEAAGAAFDYGTAYQAEVVLQTAENCLFAENTTISGITAEGAQVTITEISEDKTKLTFEVSFPATADKPDEGAEAIAEAEISISQPMANAAPKNAATSSAAFRVVSTSWTTADGTPAGAVFDYETVYKAVVMLSAEKGYKFTTETTLGGISGIHADALEVLSEGASLRAELTFDATEPRPAGSAVTGTVELTAGDAGKATVVLTKTEIADASEAYGYEADVENGDYVVEVTADEPGGTTGTYTIKGVAPGEYTLLIRKPGALYYQEDKFVVEAGGAEAEPVILAIGDLDQDGFAEFSDLLLLLDSQNYGMGIGAEGVLALADLDDDGEIGFSDLLLLLDSQNYGQEAIVK